MPAASRAVLGRIGLTGRGWAFLASGAAVALTGLAVHVIPVTQFGVLLAMLPLASAALTRGPGPSMELSRSLSARELATDDLLRVTVNARGRFVRGSTLLLEDMAGSALGGPHRLAITGLSGQAIARPGYRILARARGIHHVGPMRVHVVDRFGMVHRMMDRGGRDEVLVTPRVVPLDPAVLGGASAGSGSGHLGPLGAAADDVIPRSYSPGDEVRRIDWKASARTGSLMVRSEENPWRSAVTVVLDLRASDHGGTEPDSSVDVALSLAASVGVLALDSGWDLTVLTTDDVQLFTGSPITGVEAERRALLRALAAVPVSRAPVPNPAVRHSTDRAGTGPVLLVVGAIQPPSARVLAGAAAHSPVRLLVAIASEQWASPGSGAGHREPAQEHALEEFRAAGWRIARLERDTTVASAWADLVAAR